MRKPVSILASCLALWSCDKAKNFIDPSGKAYGGSASGTPAPAAATAPGATANAPPPPPPPPPAGGRRDVPVVLPAQGRTLSESEVVRQVPGIEFSDSRTGWTFRSGVARAGKGLASWVDSAGRPWAVGIGDLDLDGSDDAVLLVRWDEPGVDTRWELAFLRNQSGRLFNTQTLDLPGSSGFREVVVDGSSITLVPVDAGPNVFAGYSGGRISLAGR